MPVSRAENTFFGVSSTIRLVIPGDKRRFRVDVAIVADKIPHLWFVNRVKRVVYYRGFGDLRPRAVEDKSAKRSWGHATTFLGGYFRNCTRKSSFRVSMRRDVYTFAHLTSLPVYINNHC